MERRVTKHFGEITEKLNGEESSSSNEAEAENKCSPDVDGMSFGEGGVDIRLETNSNISQVEPHKENLGSEGMDESGILHRPPRMVNTKLLPKSKNRMSSIRMRLCPSVKIQTMSNHSQSFKGDKFSDYNSSAHSRSINGKTAKLASEANCSDKSKLSNKKMVAVVIDDEILNADFFQECLEQLGFDVYVAYNGELGIELFMKLLTFNTKVSLLVIDYSMPRLNGDDCVRKLRSPKFDPILKECIIVGLTAHRDPLVKEKCLEAQMNYVEYKPISANAIKNLLKKIKLIE